MKRPLIIFSVLFLSSVLLSACGGGGGSAGSPGVGGNNPGGGTGPGGGGGPVLQGWIQSTGLGIIATTNDGIIKLSCPKNTTVCFSAGPGSIQKSSDAGVTWTQVHTFTSNNPAGSTADVSFADVNYGFVMKSYGLSASLWNTTDGGTTWMATTSAFSTTPIKSIAFTDATHGVATSAIYSSIQGSIFYTTDGGATFNPSTLTTSVSNSGFTFNKPVFVSTTTGFAVGGNGSSGMLIKTTDSGHAWADIPLGISGYFTTNQVSFIDSLNGYIQATIGGGLGTPSVLSTADGGKTWTSHTFAFGNFGAAWAFSCFDTTHCLAATMGGMVGSKDGGVTWTLQYVPTLPGYAISDLAMTSATHGVIVGDLAVVSANPVSMTWYNLGLYTNTGGF